MRLPTKTVISKEKTEKKEKKKKEDRNILSKKQLSTVEMEENSAIIGLCSIRVGIIDCSNITSISIDGTYIKLECRWDKLEAILVSGVIGYYGYDRSLSIIAERISGVKISKTDYEVGNNEIKYKIDDYYIVVTHSSKEILENIHRIISILNIEQSNIQFHIQRKEVKEKKSFWADKLDEITPEIEASILFRKLIEEGNKKCTL